MPKLYEYFGITVLFYSTEDISKTNVRVGF